jgi:acyl carrier protein
MSTMNVGSSTTLAEITDWLTGRVAFYLEMSPADVSRSAQLVDLGFDSVYAMTLGGDIEEHLGLEVEPTVAWDHPTIDALAAYLHGALPR